MRVLETSENKYSLFIMNEYFNNIDISKEKDLEKLLTKIMLNLKNDYDLKLSGLYLVEIYINEKVGAFIYIEKTDTFIQYRDIDLKIKIFRNSKFYFKTESFEVLEDMNNIYFYNEYYYIDTDELDNILIYLENGELILCDDINIEEGIKIK